MSLELYAEKLPPELQEAYKAEIAKAVIIGNREDASKLITGNAFLNAEFQSLLGKKAAETHAKFEAEKPGLVEEEIKKRSTKDPATIEIEKLRAEIAEERRNGILKERKSQAIAELSKHGLDPALADFVVTDDEERFRGNIETLTGKVISWRDESVKKVKSEVFGKTTPQGGNIQTTTFTRETMKTPEGRKAYSEAIKSGASVSIQE
jgi:hypothetical protein